MYSSLPHESASQSEIPTRTHKTFQNHKSFQSAKKVHIAGIELAVLGDSSRSWLGSWRERWKHSLGSDFGQTCYMTWHVLT